MNILRKYTHCISLNYFKMYKRTKLELLFIYPYWSTNIVLNVDETLQSLQ